MKTKNTLSFSVLPKDYNSLVALFPPRPIHDRVAHDTPVEVVDAMAGHTLNKDQEDYLEILSRTIETYETGLRPAKVARGRKLLAALVGEHELTAARLGKFIGVDGSHAAKILRGDRSITTAHAKKLARHFAVSVESLLT
jgi:antitoxin component HigA of HigAB toxin-antitoxin module